MARLRERGHFDVSRPNQGSARQSFNSGPVVGDSEKARFSNVYYIEIKAVSTYAAPHCRILRVRSQHKSEMFSLKMKELLPHSSGNDLTLRYPKAGAYVTMQVSHKRSQAAHNNGAPVRHPRGLGENCLYQTNPKPPVFATRL